MAQADTKADNMYDALRESFGEASPKASGYLSEYSFLQERDLVLDAVGVEPGTVVDLGCGGGLMTLPLVQAGHRVIGLDFNAAACRQAGRTGLCAVRGDAFNLPLTDALADVVVNVEVAQQYEAAAVERLLHEAARILRPGGRLVIVWANREAAVHRVVSTGLRILLRGSAALDLIHHPPSQMRAAAVRAGFALDEWRAIFPPWRWRLRSVSGLLASLVGSSFIAIFRTRPES